MGMCIIGAREVENYQRNYHAQVVDIRDAEEYREYHIRGAIHVPVDEVKDFMKRADKNRIYIFYCEHGSFSFQVAKRYVREGFQICSLAGGLQSYRKWLSGE